MPFWGRGRGAKAACIAATMTIGLLLTGCATTAPRTLANLTLDETQTIDRTCAQTFGAHPGDTYFDACRTSLADAVQRRHELQRLAQTRAECTNAGWKEGSSDLALCVLGARSASSGATGPQRLKALTAASPDEVHRRVQLSCANLGLDPSMVAFSDCVAEFEASVSAAESPST